MVVTVSSFIYTVCIILSYTHTILTSDRSLWICVYLIFVYVIFRYNAHAEHIFAWLLRLEKI